MSRIPPSQATAESDTLAEHTTLVNAANALFIDQATQVIQNAIAQGVYSVRVDSFEHVDLKYIQTYFTSLGYNIGFPDDRYCQPAQEFGYFWEQYWKNGGIRHVHGRNPAEIWISWKNPHP